MSPEQARVLPVDQESQEYAEQVADELSQFRVKADTINDNLGTKIGNAHEMNVPYMLIVGSDEIIHDEIVVSGRNRQENTSQGAIKLDEVENLLEDEVESRSNNLTLLS